MIYNCDFCTCKQPTIIPVTKAEQYGGDIREMIIGYECGSCNREINPDTMPTKEELDYELYSNE